jgi:hypothetical protein
MLVRTQNRDSIKQSNKITPERGTTLSEKRYPAPSKINDLCHVNLRQL